MGFISHKNEALRGKDLAIRKGLEMIGWQAERYAKIYITKRGAVDTGRLRNSISHMTKGNTEYIGTNVEYAVYIEFGTGKYAEGGGRSTPWIYKDEEGIYHKTSGMKPRPYLRPAVKNHFKEYRQMMLAALQGK